MSKSATRKINGRLKRKYVGAQQEVTTARLERVMAAPATSETRATSPSPTLTISAASDAVGKSPLAQGRLLTTKFFVPSSSHALIPRPYLESLLQEGMRRQLTLVSAPAGFGKTTLLANWVHSLQQEDRERCRVAWLSLDEADRCVVRFWTYVFTAINKIEPGVATAALHLLQSSQRPTLEEVLTAFINALGQAPNSYALILDDFHLVNDPALHASLSYLIEHQPPHLHLIIVTRIDPALNLSRLRARGQLLEIRTEQLRCTVEEAVAFLKEIMGIELAPEAIGEITTRSEGWLVGLQLLGLSLQARSGPHDLPALLSGDHRYILDYLTEEVLRQQPASVQRFLLCTSFLENLTGSLCDAVAEQSDSQGILEYLEQANLFVKPLDEQRRWYRYHALFAETLRAKLEREDGSAIFELRLRASQWYEQQGRINEAVQQSLLARDWPRVADLIERLAEALLLKGDEQVWERGEEVPVSLYWLRQLPAEVIQARPRLALYYARVLFLNGRLKETLLWIEAAEAALTALESAGPERELLLGEVAARHAVISAHYGDDQSARAYFQQALSHLSERDSFQRSLVAMAQGLSAFVAGEVLPATRYLLEAGALAQSSGMPGAAITFQSMAASVLHLRGRLGEARHVFQQAIDLGTSLAGHPIAIVGVAYAYLADVLREWNRLDEALDLALEGICLIQQTNYALYADRAYIILARIYLSRGEVEPANAAFQQALQLPALVENPYRRRWLTAVEQVRLWIALGELNGAPGWAGIPEQNSQENWSETPFAREREAVAQSRLLLERREPEKALERLKPSLTDAINAERWDSVLEMRLLQALAARMSGKEQEALSALAQAVRLGETEGYIRRFVDEGPRMAALLSRLREQQRRREPTPYLDSLLAAFPKEAAGAGPLPQPGLLDPLSERELEVLHLVAQGGSNQEIADTLVLSVHTVKRHVYNILGKLGSNNRTQAVMHARSLGLVSDERRPGEIASSRGQDWNFSFPPNRAADSRAFVSAAS